jgi:hypothetical protein
MGLVASAHARGVLAAWILKPYRKYMQYFIECITKQNVHNTAANVIDAMATFFEVTIPFTKGKTLWYYSGNRGGEKMLRSGHPPRVTIGRTLAPLASTPAPPSSSAAASEGRRAKPVRCLRQWDLPYPLALWLCAG